MKEMNFETYHTDLVHDIQLDYFGKKIATCSSDTTIKIFDIASDQANLLSEIQGHTGAVWKITWAHPKYGTILASCSFDNTVIIWKELNNNQWSQIYQSNQDTFMSSVSSVCWSPHELGLKLAAVSLDGSACIIEQNSSGTWNETKILSVDIVGCTSVSWSPVQMMPDGNGYMQRLVIGGYDHLLKIYSYINNNWVLEKKLPNVHTDWILDCAWSQNSTTGSSDNMIVSGGQDGRLILWIEKYDGTWSYKIINEFNNAINSVCWSISDNIIACCDSECNTTLWSENKENGDWEEINKDVNN